MYGTLISYVTAASSENIYDIWVLGLVLNILSMIVCPIIALSKKRSVIGWFFGGMLLGIIGLVIIGSLPSESEESNKHRHHNDDEKNDDYDEDDDDYE